MRETFDYYQRKVPVSQDREAHAFAATRYHELCGEAQQYRLRMRAPRHHPASQQAPRPTARPLAWVLSWVNGLVR